MDQKVVVGLVGVAVLALAGCGTKASVTAGGTPTPTASTPFLIGGHRPLCTPEELFAAAVAKEHFNAADPSYSMMAPNSGRPGMEASVCTEGWAYGVVGRPIVGYAHGGTLFHLINGTWVEVQAIPDPSVCNLEAAGVPRSVAGDLALGTSPGEGLPTIRPCLAATSTTPATP